MNKKIIIKKIAVFGVLLFSLTACTGINLGSAQPTASISPNIAENLPVISEGNLVPSDFKYLTFLRPGRVEEILVSKGDIVSEGQVLARIGDLEQLNANLSAAELENLNAQITYDDLIRTAGLARASSANSLIQAENQLLSAQRAWDKIDTDAFEKSLDDLNIQVQDAKTSLEDAQTEFDKYKDLSTDNTNYKRTNEALKAAELDYREAVRKQKEFSNQRDAAQTALQIAQTNFTEAQYQADQTKSGPDANKLALASARVKNAAAQLTAAKFALTTVELKAPFAGKIVDINVLTNEQVGTSNWAFLIADFGVWYVETSDLTELKVVQISEGDSAELTADAMPEVQMNGTVSEISEIFKSQSGDILYKVRIKLLDPDPRLRWGMTFQISFGK